MSILLLNVLIGLFVSGLGVLLGLGGGFLIVPLLFILYGFSPQETVGTVQCVSFLTVLSGAFAYARQKRIDYSIGGRFVLMSVPGTMVGAYVSRFFTSELFKPIIGIILIIFAFIIIISTTRKKKKVSKNNKLFKEPLIPNRVFKPSINVYAYYIKVSLIYILGFLVGFLCGVFGVGTGMILMLILIFILKLEIHFAIATSMFILTFTSFFALSAHLTLAHVKLDHGITLGVGAIIGAQIGAWLSKKLKSEIILIVLAVVLVLVGLTQLTF